MTYKELVQYYSTDWDYMMARAEVNGFLVTVDAAKVSVKAPVTSGSPVLTYTTDAADPRFDDAAPYPADDEEDLLPARPAPAQRMN